MKDFETAKKVCEQSGSTLMAYELGVSAFLALPSQESVFISIGTTTAKILTPRSLFGLGLISPKLSWCFPRTLVSQQLSVWEPKYFELNRIARFACRALILDGLLSVASFSPSVQMLYGLWSVMKNPIEIAYSKQREDGVRRG